MKLIDSKMDMLEEIVGNPDEERALELKLGIVSQLREVQTVSQQVNQKVDKEEFVTDLYLI